jgi:hypothetical protein
MTRRMGGRGETTPSSNRMPTRKDADGSSCRPMAGLKISLGKRKMSSIHGNDEEYALQKHSRSRRDLANGPRVPTIEPHPDV